MYYSIAAMTGVLISVMVFLNGDLTQVYGSYNTAVIIHVVGVVFALALCFIRKEKPLQKINAPFWAYLGGAIGVLTTFFNNWAYSLISMTSIVALGLLGQSVTSNLIDCFGLFGMKKRPIRWTTWVGFAISLFGVYFMLDSSVSGAAFAIVISIGAGVTIVLSRTVNARLAEETGPIAGSFVNHLVGLPICIILALIMRQSWNVSTGSVKPWMFCGGMLGVLVVYLCNITIPKVSAFRLTLLSFLGEVFSGIAIDLVFGETISSRLFWGGVISAAGLLISMLLEALLARSRPRDSRF